MKSPRIYLTVDEHNISLSHYTLLSCNGIGSNIHIRRQWNVEKESIAGELATIEERKDRTPSTAADVNEIT